MSQGPAIPTYVLRGHVSPVHKLLFLGANSLLASGDGDGWLVIWCLATKRAVAVWKAHEGGVTGINIWVPDRLISHGRDHKLRVWKCNLDQFSVLNTKLPVDGALEEQPKPWLLHSMDVSALNFCTFAVCSAQPLAGSSTDGILVASPNGLDTGGVDIFRLPSERRVRQLHPRKDDNTGMVMSLAIFHDSDRNLCLISGYEDGRVMVHYHSGAESEHDSWRRVMNHKVHTQPLLSLELPPQREYFITSSADAVLAKFTVPNMSSCEDATAEALKIVNTKHAGQQGLSVRSDGKIFATAGWDARIRVYSSKSMRELAVLKWHKDGCYSTTFAQILDDKGSHEETRPVCNDLVASAGTALDRIKEERILKAQGTHWLAAGGKDGKISLWDIY